MQRVTAANQTVCVDLYGASQNKARAFEGLYKAGSERWRTRGAADAWGMRQAATFCRAWKRSFQPGGGRAGGASCGSPSRLTQSYRSNICHAYQASAKRARNDTSVCFGDIYGFASVHHRFYLLSAQLTSFAEQRHHIGSFIKVSF